MGQTLGEPPARPLVTTETGPDRVGRRLLALGAIPFVSNIMPMLALPVVSRVAGADGWAALAVGQSAGMLALIVVDYGWSIRGPIEVTRSTASARRLLYFEHLLTGSFVLSLAGVLVGLVTYSIAPAGYGWLSVAMAIAIASGGVSPSWYVIGTGVARDLLWYDVAPRSLALGLAVVLLLLTGNVWWYPSLILVGSVVATVVFCLKISRPHPGGRRWRGLLTARLRGNLPAVAINASGGAYTYGTIVIVGAVGSTSTTAAAASADRLFKIGTIAITALTNALQAWVVEDGPASQGERQRRSILAHVALGVVGGLGLVLLGSWATKVLFGPAVASDQWTVFWYGLAFALLSVNSCLNRHVLMVAGRDRAVLVATVTGALVGLPAVMIGVAAHGASGAAAGFASGEGAVLLVQLVMLARGRKRQEPAT